MKSIVEIMDEPVITYDEMMSIANNLDFIKSKFRSLKPNFRVWLRYDVRLKGWELWVSKFEPMSEAMLVIDYGRRIKRQALELYGLDQYTISGAY